MNDEKNMIARAAECLQRESEAILALIPRLDESLFTRAKERWS